MNQGRPLSNPPAFAYEYRRHILLIQILAGYKGIELRNALEGIAYLWDVKTGRGRNIEKLSNVELIHALANHTIEYHDKQ